ncbi:hypothetical protein ES703_113630 [subsurface metagenome]
MLAFIPFKLQAEGGFQGGTDTLHCRNVFTFDASAGGASIGGEEPG